MRRSLPIPLKVFLLSRGCNLATMITDSLHYDPDEIGHKYHNDNILNHRKDSTQGSQSTHVSKRLEDKDKDESRPMTEQTPTRLPNAR